MSYKSIMLPAAKQDLRNAATWYDERRAGLGKQLVKRVREKVYELKANPFICQIRYKNTRTALTEQFSYMIHYEINETDKIIEIVAILHTSQSPGLWDNVKFR